MTFRNVQVALTGNSTNLSSVLYRAGNDIDRFHNRATKGNLQTASSAVKMGKAFGVAGLAIAAGLGYAVVKAAEFDKSMRNVNSLNNLNEAGFRRMEQQVLQMSTRLPQSAKTLADGLYQISSSGFTGSQALTVLNASAQAASAGLTTTDVAAQAITATLNAYGRGAQDASDVSDVLFQTVNLGVINFEELSGVIGDTVGTAAAAKVGIDQVGSAIATMTLTGISGAEAGTSLNRVLQSVISPSEALASTLHDLGYESGAQALQADGLRGVMDKLRESTGGNIETLLKLFPEIRAARGALALMAADGTNYARVSAGIEDAEARRGATLKVLHEQMKAVSNQFQVFKNRADEQAISLGTKLLPAMLALMSAAGALGHGLGELGDWVGHAVGPAFDDLWSAAQNVWKILTDLGSELGPLARLFAVVAATPVVITLRVMATTLEAVTGFLADNREIVLALAIAYGVNFVRALILAQGGLSVAAWKAFGTVLIGVMNSADSAAGGLARLRIAQGLATAGIATLIAGGILAWKSYTDTTKKAREAIEAADRAVESGSVSALFKQRDALQKTRAELEQTIDSYSKASFVSRFWQNFNGGAADAIAAAHNLDSIDAAINRVDVSSEKAANNIGKYLQATLSPSAFQNLLNNPKMLEAEMVKVGARVQEMGGSVTGSYGKMKLALDAYAQSHSPVQVAEKQLIAAMGDLGNSADDAKSAVDQLKTALDILIGGPLAQDEALINWKKSLDDITASVKENGASLSVNTEKGRANRSTIIDAVKALKDRVEADAAAGVSNKQLARTLENGTKALENQGVQAGIGREAMRKLIAQYGLTPDLVRTIIEAAGADASARKVQNLQAQVDRLRSKTIVVTTKLQTIGVGPFAGKRLPIDNAAGRIWTESYASGGQRLPRDAMVARNGANLVQWAEPGTGGEAFIPLSPSRRERSTAILEKVAEMFGFGLADLESYAPGGFRYPDFHYKKFRFRRRKRDEGSRAYSKERADAKRQYEKDRAEAKKEWQDNKYQAYEQYRENQRLASVARGGGEGAVGYNQVFTAGGAFAEQARAEETRAQAAAQLAANRSANPYDTAADFYKKPVQSAAEMVSALKESNSALKDWRDDLAKITRGAGADVAGALQAMGEQGAQYVDQMASATTTELKAMADQMRLQQWQTDLQNLVADVQGRTQWNSNLLKLATSGHADLAAQFSQQGYNAQNAMSLQYLVDHGTNDYYNQVASMFSQQAAASDPAFGQALAIAAKVNANLGIIGLSRVSGVDVADLVGLLQRYWGQVFAPMGTKVSTLAKDRALIESGQQPTGLARGGIVTSANTGLYYRWAEPGTGGESLIPLGQRDRGRALDLWAETGRRLGVNPSGPASQASVNITLAPGAVHVPITNANSDPAAVARAVESGVNNALNKVLVRVRAGR